MTQHASARQDAPARPDAVHTGGLVGSHGRASSRTARRRVTTGTGATLAFAPTRGDASIRLVDIATGARRAFVRPRPYISALAFA